MGSSIVFPVAEQRAEQRGTAFGRQSYPGLAVFEANRTLRAKSFRGRLLGECRSERYQPFFPPFPIKLIFRSRHCPPWRVSYPPPSRFPFATFHDREIFLSRDILRLLIFNAKPTAMTGLIISSNVLHFLSYI